MSALPKGWTTVALGDLLTPGKKRLAGSDPHPILSMTRHHGLIDQSERFGKRVASSDASKYKVALRGQLVVGFPINEGVIGFQDIADAGVVSPAYKIWDVQYESVLYRRLLGLYLRSPRAMHYYASKENGSTARRRSLPNDSFLALPVPLPPLNEQRRIATILDTVRGVQEKQLRALHQLDALRESSFYQLFGTPQAWDERWPMATIGDIATTVQYGTSNKATHNGTYKILRMGNITMQGHLDFSDLKFIDLSDEDRHKYTTQPGDLLFNRTNSLDQVGKTGLVDTEEPLAIAGYLVRVRLQEGHEPEFVRTYLNSSHGRTLRKSRAKLAVNQANISASELKKLPIPFVPTDLQIQFRHRVNQLRVNAMHVHRAHRRTSNLTASLQSRAFRGEL